MKNNNNLRAWVLVIGILLILISAAAGVILIVLQTTQNAVQPVSDMTSSLGTQVAQVLHPTPTVLPDPVTIVHEIRTLARLETIQYTIEKVVTAETGQNVLAPLFGDRLLFVAHGYVTAGIDLEKIGPQDMVVRDGTLYVTLPAAEVFVATLDNEKSYVYDRETGLLTHGDINLETAARQVAENQIEQAAIDDGILDQARVNAETYLKSLLNSLGFPQVIFEKPEQ
jgi:Protein of unknown function (DUF4230)